MALPWYKKASVQSALAGGGMLLLVALATVSIETFGLKRKNAELKENLETSQIEIQRLETLLTPFRTIALEKYTGDEREALLSLVERINHMEEISSGKDKELKLLSDQLQNVSRQSIPAMVNFRAMDVSQENDVVSTTLQFSPTKNEHLGQMTFLVELSKESKAEITEVSPTADGGVYQSGKDSFVILDDKKSAKLVYQLMGVGNPTFKIKTTDFSMLSISGSHLEKKLLIDIKTKKYSVID